MKASLDPAAFRRPRHSQATRHLYLASCGRRCGDSVESLEASLRALAPDANVEAVYLGDEGVSHVSFASVLDCERAQAGLTAASASASAAGDGRRWIFKFAEHPSDSQGISRTPIPCSVEATESVEVPGLVLLPDFISDTEAARLLSTIDAQTWDTKIKRRVQHYGHAFDYARLAIAEDSVDHLPVFCHEIVQRINDAELLPFVPNQLTINEYVPGVGIASHVDAHSAFEDGIAAMSLGSGIVMEFRRPVDDGNGKVSMGKHHRLEPPPSNVDSSPPIQKNVWLPPNSLLLLRGEARYAWTHGIAWRKTDCITEGTVLPRGRRVSLTFRMAKTQPCSCAWPEMCDGQNPEAHALPTRVGQATSGKPSEPSEDSG
eukprot:TRINITY_DN69828_c0_g1_i1.p1 TRINITY_DN69828_c0_g1~~TRINITY_DN69828_c0_g1_i1.p1  ORF type:complete len:374 (-),score=62.01 TRINITY_DN69828_c0_g1_i1:49-1170(-)